MAVVIGKSTKLYIEAVECAGMRVSELNIGCESVDSSQFGDTAARKTPVQSKFSGSATGVYDPTYTAQETARQTYILSTANSVTATVKVLLDGTNGYSCDCILSDTITMRTDGLVEWTLSWEQADGAEITAEGSP